MACRFFLCVYFWQIHGKQPPVSVKSRILWPKNIWFSPAIFFKMMRLLYTFVACLLLGQLFAQTTPNLPRYMTAEEKLLLQLQPAKPSGVLSQGITDPPTVSVRTMAEWEELQAILISWNGNATWLNILVEIVRAAREECREVVSCNTQGNIDAAKNTLTAAGVDIASNVEFLIVPTNSIWVRDYGPNCVYANDVDSLYLVDWIYNRPRPKDDTLSRKIATYMGLPLYETRVAPFDLVHTGGNFMADGMGMAFSSKLLLEENDATNPFGFSNHSEAEIDAIMQDFMGIARYPKMETLPYDGIHHIDMHMKLLDEETLLVGKYPEGVSDGPQIEANLAYILDNFKTSFGTPFKVVRVPMPNYYNNSQYPPYANDALYPTYANALFVNKTVILPTYDHTLDAAAIDTFQKYLPGYRIAPVDCRNIIGSGGAVHCITKEIGVAEPLLIVHQELPCMENTEWQLGYPVWANLTHRSGIASATIHYTTDPGGNWQSVDLPDYLMDDTSWTHKGYIPFQPDGSTVYYYIEGAANNGKTLTRPLTAPEGWWSFCTTDAGMVGTNEIPAAELLDIYPNPASAITVVPVSTLGKTLGNIRVFNTIGQLVETVFNGEFPAGQSNYFIDAANYVSGTYFVQLQTGGQTMLKKLVVR